MYIFPLKIKNIVLYCIVLYTLLSDGGDRIWEIRDMETAGFLEKEAVHASF